MNIVLEKHKKEEYTKSLEILIKIANGDDEGLKLEECMKAVVTTIDLIVELEAEEEQVKEL